MGGIPLDEVTDASEAAESTGLDHIEAAAQALEGGQDSAQAQDLEKQKQQQIISAEAELLSALEMLRLMAGPLLEWWPKYADVWSDKQIAAIASAGAQVMALHGLTMGELFNRWGPYLALIGATLPPSLVTYQAVRAHQVEVDKPSRQQPHMQPPMQAASHTGHGQEGVRL